MFNAGAWWHRPQRSRTFKYCLGRACIARVTTVCICLSLLSRHGQDHQAGPSSGGAPLLHLRVRGPSKCPSKCPSRAHTRTTRPWVQYVRTHVRTAAVSLRRLWTRSRAVARVLRSPIDMAFCARAIRVSRAGFPLGHGHGHGPVAGGGQGQGRHIRHTPYDTFRSSFVDSGIKPSHEAGVKRSPATRRFSGEGF